MVKTSITIQLDVKVKTALEKRAKKEMLELDALIEEILRRSAVSYKGNSSSSDSLEDKFVGYFSRKPNGKVSNIKKVRKKANSFYQTPLGK